MPLIGSVALGVLMVGCGPTPAHEAGLKPADAVGQSLFDVREHADDETAFLIQDSSPRVGKSASYEETDGVEDDEWIVVAACASSPEVEDSDAVEVSVIPAASYDAATKSKVAAGEFADLVDCEGRPYR